MASGRHDSVKSGRGQSSQTFLNHLQTLEFEDLGDRTKLTQTMRFATTGERDTTMQYGAEEGAKGGFARVDKLLQRLLLEA